MTTAIIICAGEGTRWNNYRNTPKHLIELNGERLIDRTVRLLRERGVTDIHIVLKEHDARYEVPGAALYVATLDYERNVDADKFLSSKALWNKDGRTLVLYGDCFFTNHAMDTIVSYTAEEWTLFCRPHASQIIGKPWGECFAQSFYPQHHTQHEENLHYIATLYKDKVIDRCGGWEHYGAMVGRYGRELRRVRMTTNYVTIDDFTDDFDYPGDYDRWVERYRQHPKAGVVL